MNCPICYDGQLEDQLVEQWMRRGEHWVLFRNVPALVCDRCGEPTFSRDVTARFLQLLQTDDDTRPTFDIMVPVYDLQLIDAAATKPQMPMLTAGETWQDSSALTDEQGWRVFQSVSTATELSLA